MDNRFATRFNCFCVAVGDAYSCACDVIITCFYDVWLIMCRWTLQRWAWPFLLFAVDLWRWDQIDSYKYMDRGYDLIPSNSYLRVGRFVRCVSTIFLVFFAGQLSCSGFLLFWRVSWPLEMLQLSLMCLATGVSRLCRMSAQCSFHLVMKGHLVSPTYILCYTLQNRA